MIAHPFLEADFLNQRNILLHGKSVAPLIDSTILKADYLENEIQSLAREAQSCGFRAVCVPPSALSIAKPELGSSGVHLCTVVGFPLGYQSTAVKCFEAEKALESDAQEIDFVQNLSWLKEKNYRDLRREMEAIVNAAGSGLVKVILETALLDPSEILQATEIAFESGVHVIKTSTGFSSRGASLEDIKTIHSCLARLDQKFQRKLGIKASGGIKSLSFALELIAAGATRLGTSSGIALIQAETPV